MAWQVSPHQRYDKSITITGPLRLEVDYDDVDTDAVDILLKRFIDLLNEHWEPQFAYRCENEDCERGWDGYSDVPRICGVCGVDCVRVELES
jgi:hypothetical protein